MYDAQQGAQWGQQYHSYITSNLLHLTDDLQQILSGDNVSYAIKLVQESSEGIIFTLLKLRSKVGVYIFLQRAIHTNIISSSCGQVVNGEILLKILCIIQLDATHKYRKQILALVRVFGGN